MSDPNAEIVQPIPEEVGIDPTKRRSPVRSPRAPRKPRATLATRGRLTPAQLRSPEGRLLHGRLMGFYSAELERQRENRKQQHIDHEFYDGHQWSEEDKETLRLRGQDPLVFNVVATSIDWITGSEMRTRTDFKVIPRRKEGSRGAELKSDLLKYLSDVNDLEFSRSAAFKDAAVGGVGWVEDGWQDDGGEEPVYSRHEDWRNMLWDSANTNRSVEPGRYQFRSKWVDLDVAIAWFPTMENELRQSAANVTANTLIGDRVGDDAMDSLENEGRSGMGAEADYEYERPRVRLIEGWYKIPGKFQRIKGGDFSGETYDPLSRGHYDSLASGDAVVVEKSDMVMRVAIMTPEFVVFDAQTPYRHQKYPFTPIWCYRRNATNLPYGVVRRLRDPQTDINKRAAKALHILSTNKVVMDEGAVANLDEFVEENSRADAVIVKRPGHELILDADRGLEQGHIELMHQSISMIQTFSGVTDENRGVQTNAKSGIAIQRRQDQGALTTAPIFDNLLFAKRKQGEKQLSLIEQFYTEEKSFRITNQRGKPIYVTMNATSEDGDVLPEDDVTRTKADYVITDAEWSASVRQAQTQQLIDMLQAVAPADPQVWLVMLDLIVEGMDVHNREEIVKRIRSISGQRDPDAAEPTPEEQALAAKKAEAEDRSVRMEEATIAEKEASAAQKQAAAGNADAAAKNILATMAGTNVGTQKAALEAAMMMLQVPQSVPVADVVARESGFVSRGEEDDAADVDDKASQLEQLASEGAAMQDMAAQAMQPEPNQPEGGPVPPAAPLTPQQPSQ